MKLEDVDLAVMGTVVKEFASRGSFRTKDVSEHEVMRAAHLAHVGEEQYHSLVGKTLRRNDTALGIRLREGPRHERGEVWEVV